MGLITSKVVVVKGTVKYDILCNNEGTPDGCFPERSPLQ